MNDPKIDKISQKFASKLSKLGELDYSSNEYQGLPLGETVYKSENYFAPLKLAKALYDEISEYDFKSKDPEPNNFSQMVWKDSELIGFGMAKSSEGKYFYVINYFPTGNIDGEFRKNVFPNGTKLEIGNNKQNKKEEIKNDINYDDEDEYEDDVKISKKKYVIKKVVKEYHTKKEMEIDKEFDDFKKKFDDFDINDEDEEEEEIEVHKNTKDNNNMKNILSELIKNKKKQQTKPKENNNNKSNNYKIEKTNSISNSDFNAFCSEALEYHNKYRKMHHAPPLKLNKELCSIAENYAKTLATELQCLQHSENTYRGEELGENLYGSYGTDATGQEVSKDWYDEIKKYNFNGDWQSGCGHFTQMVWKETKEVGFGKWRDKSGQIYVVGNYYPAGNFLGCFKENVLRK